MKCLSTEIMIRHIKLFLIVTAVSFAGLNCRKKEPETVNRIPGTEKSDSIRKHNNNLEHYAIWKYAPNNKSRGYQEYTLYISEDSMKVFNGDTEVCSGEIVQEKNTYAGYFKSAATGKQIKAQLKKDFSIAGTDNLLVIMNADGDIAKKGCQFPFNDVFIADWYLFFYKDGYHAFMSDHSSQKTAKDPDRITFSGLPLPYQKKTDYKNAQYRLLPVKGTSGLSEFSCGEPDVRYIPLEKTKNIQLILLPMDCGDAPYRYYLLSVVNHRVVSNVYVEGELYEPESMGNPEITCFSISKESVLTVKTTNKDFTGKNTEKSYIIDNWGRIVEYH